MTKVFAMKSQAEMAHDIEVAKRRGRREKRMRAIPTKPLEVLSFGQVTPIPSIPKASRQPQDKPPYQWILITSRSDGDLTAPLRGIRAWSLKRSKERKPVFRSKLLVSHCPITFANKDYKGKIHEGFIVSGCSEFVLEESKKMVFELCQYLLHESRASFGEIHLGGIIWEAKLEEKPTP